MEFLTNLNLFEKIIGMAICLLLAFLIYVSMTTKKYKKRNMTFFEKLGVYFHKCPCGGKIEAYSWGKYKCDNCSESYYS